MRVRRFTSAEISEQIGHHDWIIDEEGSIIVHPSKIKDNVYMDGTPALKVGDMVEFERDLPKGETALIFGLVTQVTAKTVKIEEDHRWNMADRVTCHAGMPHRRAFKSVRRYRPVHDNWIKDGRDEIRERAKAPYHFFPAKGPGFHKCEYPDANDMYDHERE